MRRSSLSKKFPLLAVMLLIVTVFSLVGEKQNNLLIRAQQTVKQVLICPPAQAANNMQLIPCSVPNAYDPYAPKPTRQPTKKPTPTGSGSSSGSKSSKSSGGGLVKQWDPRWASKPYGNCGASGTMAKAACGPTSLAMAISHASGKEVLPPEVAQKVVSKGWRPCGSGTAHEAMVGIPKMYGLKSKQVSWQEAKKFLSQGLWVIQVHKSGYFTKQGHFIVVTGGSNGKYKINDPDGFHRTEATESQITASAQVSWVIQK